MIENKLPNKKVLNFDHSSTNSKNINSMNNIDSSNIPEDTNEYETLNINKINIIKLM